MGENHMHVAIYNDKMIAPIIFYMHVMWLSIIGSYNDRIYACTCMKLIYDKNLLQSLHVDLYSNSLTEPASLGIPPE